MKVMIVADGHYYRTPDGEVYSEGVYGYNFFRRYLPVFGSVCALVRIADVPEAPPRCRKASGEGVSFLAIPAYRGPVEYLQKYGSIKRAVMRHSDSCDCAVMRVPSATGQLVYNILRKKKGYPVALEVVVDPWEYFAPKTVKGFYRPFIRLMWTMQLKKMCRTANGVSYVTEKYLQRKYPCRALGKGGGDFFTESYSSVEIKDGSISEPKVYAGAQGTFHFVHAAVAFNSEGKGHITLMRAMKLVLDKGYDADLTFIGDGPLRKRFEDFAAELGIGDRVIFTGRLPGVDAVRNQLRSADVFVFPTRAEGLPRVLIEAMAEGLPCISTPVCGIPEILSPEWMCGYDDFEGFAGKMMYCIDNPRVLNEQSVHSIATAGRFVNSELEKRRNGFYLKLKELALK